MITIYAQDGTEQQVEVIAAFKFKDSEQEYMVYTQNETDDDGKILFHTKGLANIVEDPIVTESQLYGVVIYKCMILSLIYKQILACFA